MKNIRGTVLASVVVAIGTMASVVRAADARVTLPINGGPATAWVDAAWEETSNEPMLAKATERGEALLKRARWSIAFPFPIDNGQWTFFNAGDRVVCTRETNSFAVDKATGKVVWNLTEGKIRAVAAGANGAEMVVLRTEGNDNTFVMRSDRFGGYTTNTLTATVEIVSVADRATRWHKPVDRYSSVFLMTPKQIFAGTVVTARYLHDTTPRLIIMAGAKSAMVTAYDRQTGEKQWSYSLPEKVMRTISLAFGNGVLYVEAGALSGRSDAPFTLVALNGTDGKPMFTTPMNDALSPVAIKDDVIIASSFSGVVGLDAKTGDQKWQEQIWLSKVGGQARLTMQMDLFAAPVVLGDTMLVPAHGSTTDAPARLLQPNGQRFDVTLGLAAFDLKTHQQVWFFRPRSGASSSLRGVQWEKGKLVAAVTSAQRSYIGVDPKTGKLDWLIPLDSESERFREVIYPLLSDGVLYLVKENKLMAVPLEGN